MRGSVEKVICSPLPRKTVFGTLYLFQKAREEKVYSHRHKRRTYSYMTFYLYMQILSFIWSVSSLRKQAYSNILKNLQPKTGKFSDKNSHIFHISAQNIDCWYSFEPPRRGDSNEYPQPMFLSRNKKNNVYPCKPQFYYIKVGFKGVKII